MTASQRKLLDILDKKEKIIKGYKWQRLLHNPLPYLSAIFYNRLKGRFLAKGKRLKVPTFFSEQMDILLPAATDIFIMGLKTHDSEIRLTRFLIQNLEEGDIFADVGAHYGFFSLLAAKLVGLQGQVFSFDASAASFDVLTANTALYSNISAIHAAVGAEQGKELTFFEFPVLFSEYNTRFAEQYEGEDWAAGVKATAIKVSSVRLDDFFREMNVFPKIIKIDVEGAELEVIEGLQDTLARESSALVLEFSTDERKNRVHWEALAYLSRINYHPYLITKEGGVQPALQLEAYLGELGLESDNLVFLPSRTAVWPIAK